METPVPLAEVRVRTQDGGLGVRGPDAAGVFGAVGWGGSASDEQAAPQIMAFSNPADAAAKLWGPLRDLVVQALSIAGTVCYAMPIQGQIGTPAPAMDQQGTLTASRTDGKPLLVPHWVRTLGAKLTTQNTIDAQAAGAAIVPVVNGKDYGAPIVLAGAAAESNPVLDFAGIPGLQVVLAVTSTAKMATGITWDFAVGEPTGNAGRLAAVDALLASRRRFEWISLAGATEQSLWSALATKGQTALTQYHRFIHFKCQARAPGANETTSEWVNALAGTERGQASDGRVQVYAGWLRVADPITGAVETRGLSEIGAGWSARRRPHEPVDAVEYGPLPGVVGLSPSDLTAAQIETLDGAGYSTARTYPGQPGVYLTQGRTLAAHTSDFRTEERRRVMDRACRLVYERQWRFLNGTVQIDQSGRLVGIRTFQRASQQPLDEMARRQEISSGEVSIDPLQDVLATETIEAEIKIVPLGKLRTIRTTISFRNPLLDAAAQTEAEQVT